MPSQSTQSDEQAEGKDPNDSNIIQIRKMLLFVFTQVFNFYFDVLNVYYKFIFKLN